MAFFILIKGHITNFNFPYIKDDAKPRLADTQIHAEEEKVHYYEEISFESPDVYAIEIMTKKLKLLSPANFVEDALKVMRDLHIHHIPLEVDNRIVGIISERDIKGKPKNSRLVDSMERTVLCVSESTPLRHIISVFMHEYVHCLPVVDDGMRVTGIITDTDIYKWMLDNQKYYK